MKKKRIALILLYVFVVVLIFTAVILLLPKSPTFNFDGNRAFQDLVFQVDLGPRIPGSIAHQQEIEWLSDQLISFGWDTQIQTMNIAGENVQNVIAKRGDGKPWIILGVHYDSRQFADHNPDPALQTQPVPGANDGASGVAVLLEIARNIPKDPPYQIWLVFFDLEDQGNINGQEWIIGSRAFVSTLTDNPDAAIIIDMIGDRDLHIYEEKNSDAELTSQIWNTASKLGYQQQFVPQKKYSMLDDHAPFLERGIKAIDIIDFDYPYWHTTQDTPDKTSAQSLKIIGDTLLAWLNTQ